jgi:hypothetical protein
MMAIFSICEFCVFSFGTCQHTDLPEIEVEPVTATKHDAGMPTLAERAAETSINRDGMPQQVGIPKPAPIPEGIDVQAAAEQQPIAIEEPISRVQQEIEQQKMHRLV